MGATLILDLANDCSVVRHHYHDLVDDQRKKVLKSKVDRQQLQVVDVQRPLRRGPCARDLVRLQVSPPPQPSVEASVKS